VDNIQNFILYKDALEGGFKGQIKLRPFNEQPRQISSKNDRKAGYDGNQNGYEYFGRAFGDVCRLLGRSRQGLSTNDVSECENKKDQYKDAE
jgi:hypothetical protein